MKREILFRGLSAYGKGWIYGNLLNEETIGEVGVNLSHDKYATVIPESIGQFTGLTDKNGKRVFEGDKLRDDWFNDLDEIVEDYCVVVWDLANCQWAIDNSFKKDGSSYTNLIEYLGQNNLEVIGNIHEEVL